MKHLIAAVLASLALGSLAAAERPNIAVILVDDMGFSDIGCYGSEIPTPNLDALAAGGLRFTQFYNTGRCCPTRASLLTGLYPHQAGVGHMTEDRGAPGYQGRLNDRCATIAEVLRPAGYFTIFSGKWHVGQIHGVTPWGRGFERNLNASAGGFYFADSPRADLFLNGQPLDVHDPQLPAGWYSTDLWTDYAIRFVDEALAARKPFYLHLCYNAPHFPLQAPAAEIAAFRGKYKMGWDALRTKRHARQIALGIVDKAWPLSPRPEAVAAWDSLDDASKDRFDHIMSVYAACVAHMDKAVGRLADALRARGVLDNTLILFMSDNGGNAESGPRGRNEGDPATARSDWFCGESWAQLENTPFRRYKHFNHEGGIATPLIAHWPAGIAARGEIRRTPGHVIDFAPTIMELAGGTWPAAVGGTNVPPLPGRSLVPAFAGDGRVQREDLWWFHQGNRGLRVGDWKLVAAGAEGPWELYDLAADRCETADLSAKQPERLQQMIRQWQKRADQFLADARADGQAEAGPARRKK